MWLYVCSSGEPNSETSKGYYSITMPLKASKRYKMRKEATLWIECLWISWKLTPSHFARVFSLLLFWSFSFTQPVAEATKWFSTLSTTRANSCLRSVDKWFSERNGGWMKRKEKKCKKNAKILVAHVFAQVFIRSIVPSFLRSSCSSPFRCIQTKTNEPYIAFASIYYGYVALKTT